MKTGLNILLLAWCAIELYTGNNLFTNTPLHEFVVYVNWFVCVTLGISIVIGEQK